MIDTAAILAAGLGARLGPARGDRPKGFLELGNRPIVEESILRLAKAGIRRIVIVTGYGREHYDRLAARHPGLVATVHNPRFAESGSLYSLYLARDELPGPFLLVESDLIYEPRAITALLDGPEDAILLSGPTGAGDEVYVAAREGRLVTMSKDPAALGEAPAGELVGLTRLSAELFAVLIRQAGPRLGTSLRLDYETDGLVGAAREHPIHCLRIDDLLWAEIDDARHLRRAASEIYPRLPPI